VGKVNKQGTDVFPGLPEELSSGFPVDGIQVSGFRNLSVAVEARVARGLFSVQQEENNV